MSEQHAEPGKGVVQLDDSQWPVFIVTTPPEIDDAELEAFLEEYSVAIKKRKERYGLVLDVSRTKKMNPVQRKKLVGVMEQNKEFNARYCACCAMVFSSAILRGVLTAIFWFHKPPHPTKVYTTRQDAIDWAKLMVQTTV